MLGGIRFRGRLGQYGFRCFGSGKGRGAAQRWLGLRPEQGKGRDDGKKHDHSYEDLRDRGQGHGAPRARDRRIGDAVVEGLGVGRGGDCAGDGAADGARDGARLSCAIG